MSSFLKIKNQNWDWIGGANLARKNAEEKRLKKIPKGKGNMHAFGEKIIQSKHGKNHVDGE